MKHIALILVALAASIVTAQKSIAPSAWYAVPQDEVSSHSFMPANTDFEFDMAASVLPDGFTVTRDASGRIDMEFSAKSEGVEQAKIVVLSKQSLAWSGPKITHRDEYVLEIARYSSTVAPFFAGLTVVGQDGDPNQLSGT